MIQKLLRTGEGRTLKKFEKQVKQVNLFEPEMEVLTDDEILEEALRIKKEIQEGAQTVEDVLPEVFALVRETAKRKLGQRHYDTQILGGIVLFNNRIAEMKTGEGKTLTSTLAIVLRAFEGKGVHVVTVNEYLASRDAEWMEPVYSALGLSVAALREDMENAERQKAYAADITYGTNSEFGFDYLRDHLVLELTDKVQRPFHYAIVDEIDSILIDEARTPLIISGKAYENKAEEKKVEKTFRDFARLARKMEGIPFQEKLSSIMANPEDRVSHVDDPDFDYEYDEKRKLVSPSKRGIEKAEKMLGIENMHLDRSDNLANHLHQVLLAEAIYKRDRDYAVIRGKIEIIDPHTGRVLEGHRWSNGLHQAIEAKENLKVIPEDRTQATITYQNFFRLYPNLAGMTGTALTEATEFQKIYKLEVVEVPTNVPVRRVDKVDKIYSTMDAKWKAVVSEIKERHEQGQPVLVGTASIENSEILYDKLRKAKVSARLLNAKPENAEREGEIISSAGHLGKVTIATNMAGRGVDIKLGKNEAEKEKILELGGLYVLGTERHESRRIDNQLRGRSGRQGDPGESQFFISAEDELIRIFAGDKLKSKIQQISAIAAASEDTPIESKSLTKVINSAQERVEKENFLIRKHVLEYDDVVNEQRLVVYRERDALLDDIASKGDSSIQEMFYKYIPAFVAAKEDEYLQLASEDFVGLAEDLSRFSPEWSSPEELEEFHTQGVLLDKIEAGITGQYEEKRKEFEEFASEMEAKLLLTIVDRNWQNHLDDMEYIKEGIGLRGFAQLDPLVAYKNEGYKLYQEMQARVWEEFLLQFLTARVVINRDKEALEA